MSEVRKPKKNYTPEQKHAMVNQIETLVKQGFTIADAVEKSNVAYSNYHKWKKQLAVGVKSSLRNGKAPVDRDKKKMQLEIERLKSIVLSQAEAIAVLKKETNWD